jgi:hypothetical protein
MLTHNNTAVKHKFHWSILTLTLAAALNGESTFRLRLGSEWRCIRPAARAISK